MTKEDFDAGYQAGYENGQMLFFEGYFDDDTERLIMDGEFDESVRRRSEALGYVKDSEENMSKLHNIKQALHHLAGHDISGPVGYEFCGRTICLNL